MSCSVVSGRLWPVSFRLIVCSVLLLCFQLPIHANQNVVLAWNPIVDPSVAGVRIYYGVESHAYTSSVDAGNVNRATISVPDGNMTYYFAATTYDTFGNESDFSNEASFTVTNPPSLAATTVVVTNPATLSAPVSSGGNFSFSVSGKSGDIYILQSSTDLKNWVSIQTNAAPFVFVQTNAGLPQQFFRAVGAAVATPVSATLNSAVKSGGQFVFNVTGTPGFNYVVETSSDLIHWLPVQTKTAPFQFVDGDITQPKRFYRAVGEAVISIPVTPAAPAMTALNSASGQFSFGVTGTAGAQYVVQASTNLVDWVSVETNTAPFTFADPNTASYKQRFFRTLSLAP